MYLQVGIAQENTCGFHETSSQADFLIGLDGIKFFDENEVCTPLTLKCNYVIIRRDDGSGNLDPSSPFWSEWEQQMNQSLANITDVEMCSTGYPLDSKVRVDFEVHTIDNTAAWDWYAEANADNYPSSLSPNIPYVCPRFDNSWTALEGAMTDFEQSHFGEINFFFIDNGELVGQLEDHLANGTEPSEPYYDRFEQYKIDNPGCFNCGSIASGCSIFPQSYFSQASENSYVISHTYSDYLTRQNFHDIQWPEHANQSPETVWSWSYNGKPLLFLHEMGHNVLNMFHRSSCRQLMTSSWNQRTNHITKTQLETLHRNLASTDLHNAVDCSSLSGVCSVQVVADETLDQPMSVFGDLVIKSGIEFTVTSQIFFSEQSRIIVEENAKLIVNGGLLTSGCGSTWKGIKVYGGNSDFDVKFTNSATIENTSEAAVSMFAPEPWPAVQQWGNGILEADNTTFNNTKRIAEFMSWSPLPNPSYIRDCVQNGGKWSITNWNCQGIDIRDNVFNDITNECIVNETGQFTIIGNEFNSGQSDILFNNVSAGISTLVESNQFNGSNTGYNARGTTFAQNEIRNNNFQTGNIDVMNDGHNQYDLWRNNITAPFGAATFDGGGGIADVHNNDFSGNLAGALPIGINEDYNFYENCYATTVIDNHIVGQISPLVHSNGSAANNCFTHGGSATSSIQDMGGSPDPFTYLEPQDDAIDCRDGILAHPNVNRVENGQTPDQPACGSDIQGGGTPNANYCWPDRYVKDEVWNAYTWLSGKLKEIDSDPSLSAEQKEFFTQFYKRCFWRVRGYLFEILVKESKYQEGRDLFVGEVHDDAKVFIYSSYIMENDLTTARTYLNSISTDSEQMADFVTIQDINLDRLPYGPFYNANSTELSTVRAIALKSHPYTGYAKALHYVLTGELISSQMPDIGGVKVQPRSTTNSNAVIESSKVYPNPFSNTLNIEIKGYENVTVNISDFLGRTVYTMNTEQPTLRIPTETWHQGIYLIRMESDGKIVHTDKIILVH